jgi:hypothetical protein
MAAYGPSDKLEVSLGGVFGYTKSPETKASFSYALPLVQAKYLFRPYRPGKGPGFGAVMGSRWAVDCFVLRASAHLAF